MKDPLDELFGRVPETSDAKASFASIVEPGETIVWTGAPRPGSVFVMSLPPGIFGLIFTSFALLWIVSIVHGGKNNWDHGKVVEPFAPYNVGIAMIAGFWFLSPGVWLLTWPLRAWNKAKKTRYAVTDRRVLIVEPDLIRGVSVRRFSPSELLLMRRDERKDGSGNLIIEEGSGWSSIASPVGFLAIERVRDVESLIQKTLVLNSIVERVKRSQFWDDDKDEHVYRISMIGRFLMLIPIVIAAIVAFCLVGFVIATLVVLIVFPDKVLPFLAGQAKGLNRNGEWGVVEIVVLGAAQFVIGGLSLWGLIRSVTTTPMTIVLNGAGESTFRSVRRTIVVRAEDVDSIVAGAWFDPNRHGIVIRHKGGKISLTNYFPAFHEYVINMKYYNPSIRVEGMTVR